MITVRCKKCGARYDLDETNIDKTSEWFECVMCGAITKNPFKET